MQLPEKFIQNVRTTFAEKGEAWLKALPQLTQKYLSEWKLKPDGSFTDNLSYNFVLPVMDEVGSRAVLKIGPHLKGRAKESRAQKKYQGEGAVLLMKSNEPDGVSLLERAVPGAELKVLWQQGKDEEATKIATQLMMQLLQERSNPTEFTHISVWGLGFEKFIRENRRGLDFPTAAIEKADRLFKELNRSAPTETLLHADLHHSNILQAIRQPWLAIDPKGMWGDPAYEVGALMRNPFQQLVTAPNLKSLLQTRMDIMEQITGFERARIWGWSYSQCVLAAIWAVEDANGEWQKWLQIAEAIEALESKN